MSVETLSFMVRCWHDSATNATRIQVIPIDTAEEVHLNNSKFLVRAAIDRQGLVERCFIRHIASGREAYVQGGPGLSAFVQQCLLSDEGGNRSEQ